MFLEILEAISELSNLPSGNEKKVSSLVGLGIFLLILLVVGLMIFIV
jgi:hypothetical protein